jgi:hypothetical protein
LSGNHLPYRLAYAEHKYGGIIVNKLVALITSTVLLLNISNGLASGHQSKSAKKSGDAATATDGMTNGDKSKNKQKQGADRHDNDASDKDKDKDKSGNNKGNEQSQEMRDRRDERKDIQEDYRADREPGQEGKKADGDSAKKPWYKFWE